MVAGVVQRPLAAGHGQRALGGDAPGQAVRMGVQGGGVRQHGVHQAHRQRTLGAHAVAAVGHLTCHAGRHDLGQALQHAQVGGHADVNLLHGEEGVGAAHADIAGRGQVQRAAHAAALHRADRGKARLVQHIRAGHQAAQPVLEGQAVARGGQTQQVEPAGEHFQRHAGAEVPARGAQHEGARAALVAQALHRVAQRGKERRRQRVQPFRPAQLQRGHARGVVQVQGEEIVHGAQLPKRVEGWPGAAGRAGRWRFCACSAVWKGSPNPR